MSSPEQKNDAQIERLERLPAEMRTSHPRLGADVRDRPDATGERLMAPPGREPRKARDVAVAARLGAAPNG